LVDRGLVVFLSVLYELSSGGRECGLGEVLVVFLVVLKGWITRGLFLWLLIINKVPDRYYSFGWGWGNLGSW